MGNVNLDWTESNELADFVTRTKNLDEDYATTENGLFEKWGIDCDIFQDIANSIFKSVDFGISPITQTAYVGFSKGNEWIAKKEVDQQFIHALIQWCTEGEEIPEGSKGFKRIITKSSKPEYEIIIRKSHNK